MKLKSQIVVLLITLVCGSGAYAQQEKETDSEILSTPMIGFFGGVVFPGGEMQDMFNPFMSFGINGMYKTNKNWLWGVEGSFFFGTDNLRKEPMQEILAALFTSDNTHEITGWSGTDAGVTAYNRGFTVSAKGGKLFPVTKKNLNSGILFLAGAGYFQNQIIFSSELEKAPQLSGDYAKGYDRQARGFQLSQYLGYMYMSNNSKYLNFQIGFEVMQAWSWSTRDYIFDLHGPDNSTHFDLMYMIKASWMFPLTGRKAKGYYYY